MNSILIPIEFADNNEKVVIYGANLARDLNLSLLLVHVIDVQVAGPDIPQAGTGYGYTPQVSAEVLKQREEAAGEMLNRYVKHINSYVINPPPVYEEILHGTNIDQIVSRSNMDDVEMVLVKEDEDHSALIGSIDEKVASNAGCPVWIIPPDTEYRPLKQIVYATDYNHEDIETLKRLSHIAARHDSHITSVHVIDDKNFDEQIRQEGFEETISEKVGYQGISVTSIPNGSDVDGLVENLHEFAHANQANVIVILKENRSFFEKLFDKSATKKLIKTTNLPVLVYHE